jgi:hypothetical protein
LFARNLEALVWAVAKSTFPASADDAAKRSAAKKSNFFIIGKLIVIIMINIVDFAEENCFWAC